MQSFRVVSEGPTVQDLRGALEDVASFMDARSLPYASEVRKALAEVSAGDAHGARRYLGLNRALLDIYFHPWTRTRGTIRRPKFFSVSGSNFTDALSASPRR